MNKKGGQTVIMKSKISPLTSTNLVCSVPTSARHSLGLVYPYTTSSPSTSLEIWLLSATTGPYLCCVKPKKF